MSFLYSLQLQHNLYFNCKFFPYQINLHHNSYRFNQPVQFFTTNIYNLLGQKLIRWFFHLIRTLIDLVLHHVISFAFSNRQFKTNLPAYFTTFTVSTIGKKICGTYIHNVRAMKRVWNFKKDKFALWKVLLE